MRTTARFLATRFLPAIMAIAGGAWFTLATSSPGGGAGGAGGRVHPDAAPGSPPSGASFAPAEAVLPSPGRGELLCVERAAAEERASSALEVRIVVSPETDRPPDEWAVRLTRCATDGESASALRVIERDETARGAMTCVLEDLPSGTYVPEVRADGYVCARAEPVRLEGGRATVTVLLERSAAILCRVVDDSGAPVEGAHVAIDAAPELLVHGLESREPGGPFPFLSRTDARGECAFTGLAPPGPYAVVVGGAGVADHRVSGLSLAPGETREVSLRVDRGAYVSFVLGLEGALEVAGAEARALRAVREGDVQIVRLDGASGRATGWIEQHGTRVGEDGRFRLGPLAAGRAKIVISLTTGLARGSLHRDVVLAPGETRDLGVVAPRFAPLEVVLAGRGFLLPDDLLVSVRKIPRQEHAGDPAAFGITRFAPGALRSVVLFEVPPGSVRVHVTSESGAIRPFRGDFDGIGVERDAIVLELEPPEPPGASEPTCRVRFHLAPEPSAADVVGLALVGPEATPPELRYGVGQIPAAAGAGRHGAGAVYRDLRPGAHELWATNGREVSVRRVELVPGENVVDVALDRPAGRLRLLARRDGRPIPGARVEWYWDETHLRSPGATPFVAAVAGEDGIARLDGLPLGRELILRVHPPGARETVVRALAAPSDAPPLVVDLE